MILFFNFFYCATEFSKCFINAATWLGNMLFNSFVYWKKLKTSNVWVACQIFFAWLTNLSFYSLFLNLVPLDKFCALELLFPSKWHAMFCHRNNNTPIGDYKRDILNIFNLFQNVHPYNYSIKIISLLLFFYSDSHS